jgi:hypothetical protein
MLLEQISELMVDIALGSHQGFRAGNTSMSTFHKPSGSLIMT